MFKRVRHAYEVLSSAVERSNYNFKHKTSSSGPSRPPPNDNGTSQPNQRRYSYKQPSYGAGVSQGNGSRAWYAYPNRTWALGAWWLIIALLFGNHFFRDTPHSKEPPRMAPPTYSSAPYPERTNQPLSEPQQYVDYATTLSNLAPLDVSSSPPSKKGMTMAEFLRMFPSHGKPTCRSTFRPQVIYKGEQTTQCYSYYGPVYKVAHAGFGVLSYMGSHESDFRTGDWPEMSNFMESVLGLRQCGKVEPSKVGVGKFRSTYEGAGGIATCEVTLTVLPPKKASNKGAK